MLNLMMLPVLFLQPRPIECTSYARLDGNLVTFCQRDLSNDPLADLFPGHEPFQLRSVSDGLGNERLYLQDGSVKVYRQGVLVDTLR